MPQIFRILLRDGGVFISWGFLGFLEFWLRYGGGVGHEPSEASSAEPISQIDTNFLIYTKKKVNVKVKVNVERWWVRRFLGWCRGG